MRCCRCLRNKGLLDVHSPLVHAARSDVLLELTLGCEDGLFRGITFWKFSSLPHTGESVCDYVWVPNNVSLGFNTDIFWDLIRFSFPT